MAVFIFWLHCLHVTLIFLLQVCDSSQVEPNLCDSSCSGFPAPDLSFQRGVRYTYRYSTTITTNLHGSNAGRNGLALDCVVDIDVVSKCHLMMQIRNPQIKRLSPQKEHSVQRLKSLRESLERTRLKFSLQGGKVTALCIQEGEQVWALNIQRAILSMLQTSHMSAKQELRKETDVYGMCTSSYKRQGPVLLKIRDLKRCHESRMANIWPHSVALTEDTSVQSELHCVQRHGTHVMEEVNCTEVSSMALWSNDAGLVRTQTVSVLRLLRAQPGTPSGADSLSHIVQTDLQFEEEGTAPPGKSRLSTPQQASQSLRMLCSLTSNPQQVSQEFLHLAFHLKHLTLSQLKTLWEEASFKCRNDWQPLLESLPVCGSENCVLLLTDLMRNRELEEEQAHTFLTTIALIPHPTPKTVNAINALLEVPEMWAKALLAGSSMVYQLCRKSHISCSDLPPVQTLMRTLEETLGEGCEGKEPSRVFYALKSVGNTGLSAPALTPLLKQCVLGRSTALELRLAAIQAFRRFPCSADRSVLLQLYSSSQEDPEVRIAAYLQLMHCPDQNLFEVVKMTLRKETSSQVGSFVWSHLTNVLRSEDPMKQALIESLPDDIVSRDFEADFLKYSSYSDHTAASGLGIANLETSLIFSSKSFIPRSATANLTVYFHGRAHNLLEVDLHVENAEPLLRNIFGQQSQNPDGGTSAYNHKTQRTRRKTDESHGEAKEKCLSSTSSYLNQARAMLLGRRKTVEDRPKCWVGVKVFGNELSVFTCEDLYDQINQVSLTLAGLVVKLLKGHEIELNRRAVLLTEELVLPSLSGLPLKLGVNMTSLLSLRLKGNVNYREASHFSLTGYVKPSAYVGLSARMGVDSVLGQAAVDWVSELSSSTSLDGSVQLQEGRDVRVMLNTPEDVMNIISLSSRVFQLSGDHREEIKGAKSQTQKITCTPKTWSKIVGWQLCSNASYPFPAAGILLPAVGPVHLSVKLLKLDRGLHYYLLEAAYSLLPQRGTWFPREASIHLLLASPQSSVSRDVSLDFAFNPHRLLLRIMHPLKTIHIQGQLEQEKSIKSGKLELIIDGVHYYIMGLSDTQTFMSEQRTRYHLEAKMAGDGDPMILSANTTRELGRKMSVSASVKNVFRETASMSVSLERRRDGNSRQYSVEVEFLLPGMVSSRMLGLMEQKGSLWSSALRLKYGLGEDARHLRQECFVSQRLKSERDSNFTYIMRADHEFFCSSTAPINHKIQLRHEESPRRINSALHMSYGKHWDEINNKRTVLLSQSFKNQSTQNHTSYTLEFIFKVPEKNLNYRTQLLHTHLRDVGSESSSHLKINYNDLTPLVAGLHWKSPPADGVHKKWEGMFNLDTPWLYMYTTHKLSHLQRHTLQLTSELTARKWLTIRNLILEGFYRDRGREREARLQLYTPAVTYLQAEGRGVVGKRSVKASCSFSSLWTPPLGGEVSLEASKLSQSLQMASSYAQHNVSLAAVLNTVDKNLKKRQALVKMTFSRPKSPSTELEFEGTVEELRKDKRMYQKTAVLHLRQPFQTFPQTFLLRETLTVDLLKGLYILESKIALPGNREVIHTFTLGYKPPSPFVCSALVHPFLSDTFPSDSEICVTITSNKTQRNVHGRLRVGSKDRLSFFGQVYSNHQVLNIRANFTQQLKLQLPSFAIMEGDVCWNPENNTDFDYQARGKLRIERQECKLSVQVNGTSDGVGLYSSLSHPFKSNIPKTLEVKATVNTAAGKGSSLVHVKADGKDRVKLDAQMSHSHRRELRALGLRMNLSQSLLPTATDLHVNMATNISSDSVSVHGSYTQGNELLHLQVKGSLENTQGRQLAVSGDLRHSMANLQILPPSVGLDGVLGQSDTLVQGHLRVKAMETLYSVELRHQEDPAEALYTQDKEVLGKMSSGAYDWLAVHLGEEYMFVNVSHQLRNQGRGEVYTHLSHSFHQLNHTGLPANISGQVRWTQDGGQLSLLAHLQAGPEYLKAQLDGAKTDHLIPRWEYSCGLQHQVNALLTRGLSSSIQAKAHHQLTTGGLDIGLIFHINDKRMAHVVFNIGSRNSTSTAVVSLWQQIQLLQGLIPTYLQMNCTGDATAERLSAQCYGNVEGHPVEVQGFRSYRPHNRLCYGLSFTHLSLSAQAKGCYSSNGQKELRANLTHSTVLLLTHLGLPTKSAVRLLLRPGPRRWALGIGLVGGPRRTHLNVGLRLERPGLYSCHGLLEYGTRSITHRAEVTGRMRVESWCHVWADVTVAWDSVSSSLLVSVRCTGVGRLVWQQVRSNEGGAPYKTFLTVHGQAGKDGLRGSLGLENHQDSLQCLLSVLLKEQKGEVSWTLQHHWTSLASIIPNRVDLQGSCLLHDASLSGRVRFSISNHSAEVDVAAAWQPSTSFRATFKKNSPGFPEGELTVRLSAMANQAQFEVKSDVCSVLLLANRHRGREDNRTSWTFFVQQRCGLLKSLVSRQTSVNVSMVRSGCSTNLSTILQVDSEEKGSLILHLTCLTGLSLKASVQHSIKAVQTLGFPSFGSLTLNVPSSHLSGVDVGLELGRCYFRSKLAKETRETDGNESLYAVNVTNLCPALQGTVLPVSLVLRGLLSVSTCQMMVTSSLNVDNHDLTLDLVQSCRPWHLSGNLTHSFPDLRSRGLPHIISMEASAPGRPEQRGTLLIKAGTCHIRASRVMEAKGGPQWLWALESKCPLLQVQVNGSVWQDSKGIWTTMLDADLEGQRGFLRMKAKPWPEPSVEGQLLHNILALRGLPKNSRLTVTGRAGKQRYNTDAVLQMDGCAVSVSGAAMSYSGLQGSVVYHNNCTLLQAWNSPDMIHASGLLAVSPTFAESQVSMAIDEIELQTTLALKKTKDKNEASLHLNHTVPLLKKLGLPTKAKVTLNSGSGSNGSFFYTFNSSAGNQNIIQEMMASKTHQTVRVESHFRHTVNYLKKLGVPGNNSFQVELGSPEGNFTVHSQFGDQQAGLRLKMKCFPMTKEISGSIWHSWSWLQHRGVPLTVEGFSSIQGVFSQFQSRAQLIVDQHKLVTSGFNVSVGDGRLGLQLSYSPLVSKHTRAQFSLGTALTAHFKGPLRSVSVDVTCRDWRVQVEGDVGGWRAHGGSKEARVTLRHTVQGQISPALQLEAWGRLTESQLRCSMVVNPERSSSLALIIQGHHLPHSKDLMVKVVQNIPKMMLYLPSQLNVHSQLNQSQSSVSGLLEVLSGRRRLWALGDVASIESGYRQALELKHSYPQLKPLPRSVAVRTVYETRKWSYQVQHGAVWGNQEFSLSGLYSAPPALEMGNQTLKVHIKCIPRWTSLEATMENSLQGRLDSVSLGWTRHGRREQVRALSRWSRSEKMNETKFELEQPFSLTLSQLFLHTISRSVQREQRSSHQTHLSWNSAVPVNVSLSLNKQWQVNSSRGQACAMFSTQQMVVSSVKGCVSVAQAGNSYSQNAELRWNNRSVKQGMKYQKSSRGIHKLQVHVGLDNVSPAPCPSHTLLAKVQTNLRDHVEHTVLLGLCPPQPTLSWSGSHRVISGDEVLYTQSRLSVTGHPDQCSLTLALLNSSSSQVTNITLFSESRIGNWSVEVGASALSWPRGSGLQLQATLDRIERVWLNGTIEGQCLHTTAGYMKGPGLFEDLTVMACVGTNHSLTLDVEKSDSSSQSVSLGRLSVGRVDQRLMLKASGCSESLTSAEARVHYLSSRIWNKVFERIKTLQHLLTEFRRQSRDSKVLQELSDVFLHGSQRAEALLSQRDGGLLSLWRNSLLGRTLTESLPRFLSLLQHASLLGQQELRRPLATLAGVYQDVNGHRLETLWRETVLLWTDGLVEVLQGLLGKPHLSPLVEAGVTTFSVALDAAGQHTYHWLETRLATSLSGIRKQLASVYKFSPSDCSVTVSVPISSLLQSKWAEAGLVEILLEEWLLRPLQTLVSIRPSAELNRLKRKLMDSPFKHEALLVADQFVVTFDGHLYELPGSCPLVLAQDVSTDPSFSLLLRSDMRNFLLVEMNNHTINIQPSGQVRTNCNKTVTHTFHSDSGVTVRRALNNVHVTNQNGVSVSCDRSLELCSFTLDGWLHGTSTGLFGINDNEAGNDFPLPDGSQAENMDHFFLSWQMTPECIRSPATTAWSPVSCDSLFSSPDSPLASCFRVVDPAQFMSACASSSSRAPCRLASAFVHLCQQNYVPLDVPVQCLKV